MLTYTDLKKGVLFVKDGEPCEVVESNFSRMQQRKAVVQAKIRSLRTGKIVDMSFQPSNNFEEATIDKKEINFLYHHRGDFVFTDPKNPKDRFTLKEDVIGDNQKWLKPNTLITALMFNGELLNLKLPIKMDLKVTESPPGVQGDRSSSGTKSATIETGAVIQVPLFINEGDVIRINTESGQYVERVEKA
ncbi:MAG: Elongation factor P [Candidatus Collierbacteria bacterium GW2011_GWC2_44_13]|nr:MAG: Elongation factor P [Candidatus Collierbacteria bacterium GW2011_GWC2_44_13]